MLARSATWILLIAAVALSGCTILPTTPAATGVRPKTTAANPNTPVIDVTTVVQNLEVPWALDFAPDGRIFLTERPGRIRIVDEGRLLDEPWLTLDVATGSEDGLLGLALDPGFPTNHFVYVAHTYLTADGRRQNRLVRLREDPATRKGSVDRILLDGARGSTIHDGGRVKFGPDGKLYWTVGDASVPALAQEPASLNGKIFRLNPDGTIPADNPFPGSPVYSYGHRNPEGLAWQPGTARLYATEHGSQAGDEVNLIEAGKNYGWPVVVRDETREGMVSPVLHSGTQTWAPAGATFVTGGPWTGSLLFAGLRGQSLFRLTIDGSDPRKVIGFEPLFSGRFGRLRDVMQGPDGAVYMLTNNRDGRGQPVAEDDRLLKITFR